MGLFNKNKKKKVTEDKKTEKNKAKKIKESLEEKTVKNDLNKGTRNLKDIIAPEIDRENYEFLKVNDKFAKSFVVNGYPRQVSVKWLDQLYNYDGDMDTILYVEPSDNSDAIKQITNKIAQYESQLMLEKEKGSIKNTTRYQRAIQDLYRQRDKLEQNYESLFNISINSTLYADTEKELIKRSQVLDNKLKGRSINLSHLYLNQDEGYKATLPFLQNDLIDKYRNFNSGGLTACFPFYNNEINHTNGILQGVNIVTGNPLFVNYYDRSILNNSNVTVFGQSGSGKTFLVSLMTLRSALKGIKTTIIDPEGDYANLTRALGGSHVRIASDSKSFINPFDLEVEDEMDKDGKLTGRKIINIKEKITDLLNLIGVMVGGFDKEELSLVSGVLTSLYKDRFGFTENPESIYEEEPSLDKKSGNFYHDKKKKRMPIFSDFHEHLVEFAKKAKKEKLLKVADSLLMFKSDGVYGMFDQQTSEDLQNIKDTPLITFDVSALEESILRPIGMYIAMSFVWEKFVKKDPMVKKRVIADEAWMLVNPTMVGYEYTSDFLEKSARRIRKRNGGLLVASQSFNEFKNNPKGQAVLNNAVVNIFLQQDSTDIDGVQETFKLSNGERGFLLSANQGEFLIKMNGESSVGFAQAFDYEVEMIKGNT